MLNQYVTKRLLVNINTYKWRIIHGRAEMLKIIHGRMEFRSSCSALYLTSECTVQGRYRGEQAKRSTISPCNHVSLCSLYEHHNKKWTLFMFHKENSCRCFNRNSTAKPNNYGLETVQYEAKLRAVLKIFENKRRTNSL